MRGLFQLRFPKGFAWNIKRGGQFGGIINTAEDKILADVITIADNCGTVRDPYKAEDYEALADEVGLELYTYGTLESYRDRLASYVYTPYRTGSDSDLQKVLVNAGFVNAVVVKNNNAQDLRYLVNGTPAMWCGGSTAFCGSTSAYAGTTGYELLVNGPVTNNNGTIVGYKIGDDPDYWGYVDIVCGGVTYHPNGDINTITELDIPTEQKELFQRLILRTKPVHCWIILGVNYFTPGVIAQTGDPLITEIAQTGDPLITEIAQTGV